MGLYVKHYPVAGLNDGYRVFTRRTKFIGVIWKQDQKWMAFCHLAEIYGTLPDMYDSLEDAIDGFEAHMDTEENLARPRRLKRSPRWPRNI